MSNLDDELLVDVIKDIQSEYGTEFEDSWDNYVKRIMEALS